jgi:hypothetical protein
VLDPEELKGLQQRTSPNMEIVRSVKLSEIDPVFFETSYYVMPDRGGEKAYAILFRSLRETGHVVNGADPFDYLNQLQRRAEELKQTPSEWMPWNYRETLARTGALLDAA